MDFNLTEESPECPIGCELHAECIARDQADNEGDEYGDAGLGLPVTVEGVRRFG